MNILVTGGFGFIGSNLCNRLLAEKHSVSVIDRLSSQVHGLRPFQSEILSVLKDKVNLAIDDVSEYFTWSKFFNEEFDSIICLAAETGTGQSMFESFKYCNTNIGSIALLNDLIVSGKIKTKQVILASSRAVYGEAELDNDYNPIAVKEGDKLAPHSIYAITKLTQEQILFSGFGSVPTCALRFQNVYGPGQSLKNPYTGIISIFSTAIKNNKNIQVFDDGMMSRDFIFIDDVVNSIILTIGNPQTNGEIYNVGSGTRTTVLEVAETLKEKFKSNIKINITREKMKGDIRHNFANISKIKTLGFEPKINFDQGVIKFIDWVNSKQKLDYNNYESSIEEMRTKGILN